MHNWQENEIKILLSLRGSEVIRNQITGTVKDSVVYQRMAKLLAERGVYRTHMQVISKLKALRKQYMKHHQQKTRCGSDRVDWPFYEQCHRAFGNPCVGNSMKRQRSPTPPPASTPPQPPRPPPPPPPPPPAMNEEHQAVVVGLWDEVDDREINKHLGPVEVDDDEDQYSPPGQFRTINASPPLLFGQGNMNMKTRQWHQCPRHLGNAYTLWAHESGYCPAPRGTHVPVALMISSQYLTAVRVPLAMTWRSVQPSKHMSPHSTSDAPPNLHVQ
ncbi:uncharacterized protein LOC113167279 isoform X2 [Anabas testudineus]|uniref:uncharacterized protein LOC113167279 isoform X2 n=1 Tax=Anabas testudineus TaxID=64144 RepID=UPI000E454022|nr:uncharacterized protein LOC113167279 isoform X2 [Anabas testudineus]